MAGMYDGNLFYLNMQERAEEKWENSLPYCDGCGEKIREDIYSIDGGTYCEECAKETIYDVDWDEFLFAKLNEYRRELDV